MPSTITYANRHGREISDTAADYPDDDDDDDDESYQDSQQSDEDLEEDSESDDESSSSSSSSSDDDDSNDGDEPEIRIPDNNDADVCRQNLRRNHAPAQQAAIVPAPVINQPQPVIQPPENPGVEAMRGANPGVDAGGGGTHRSGW